MPASELRRLWLSVKHSLEQRGLLLTVAAAVLGYVSAAFLQVGIEDFLDGDENRLLPRATLVLWILNFAAIIFVAMLASILISIRSELRGVKRFSVTWSERPEGDGPVRRDGAYEYCSQKAWEAETRIDIFGPVFTHQHSDDQTIHDHYLEDGIEKAVYRRRGQKEGTDFRYKRVIQTTRDIGKAVPSGGSTMLKGAMGNDALATHVEKVLHGDRQRGVEVSVVVREPVPGFPSTMIIDDRWVFFSLPTQKTPTRAGAAGERFDYDFVIGIEDDTKAFPRQLRTIIDEFARIGTPIHGVRDQ